MERPRSFDADSLSQPRVVTPPPPSFNSLQMPNVFVIPPEEEQAETPPFLYFDASKALSMSTAPDLESLDVALDVHQQIANTAPVFQRTNFSEETIVMPRKGGEVTFVHPREWQLAATRERYADDDVVEVVKVRKHERVSDIGGGKGRSVSRSKTFKARATQAFRSIKNVGKGSRKSTVQEVKTSADAIENIYVKRSSEEASSTRRVLSKRRSRPLSQIFQFGRDDSAEAVVAEAGSPTPPESPISPLFIHSYSRPVSSASSYVTVPASLSPEPEVPRSSSPSSSTHIKRASSFRKRLSLLELPRLFSSSSSVSSTSSSNSQASMPYPSTPSPEASEPEIAIQEQHYMPSSQPSSRNWIIPDVEHSADFDDELEELDYGEIQASSLSMVNEEDSHWGDISLEMRLDSLHFDSLSFDPNDFTMTPFGKEGRRNSGRIAVL